MRNADAYECVQAGTTPDELLHYSHAASTFSEGVFKDDRLLAHWGWRDRGDGGADVWLLSFPDIEDNRIYAARRSRMEVNELLKRFTFLQAEVEVTHSLAMKWLRWLEFKPVHVKVNPFGGMFNIMERRRWEV